MKNNGYTALEALIVIVVVIVLAIFSYFWLTRSPRPTKTPTISSTASSQMVSGVYTALPPATVPSRVAECKQTVSYAANGVPSPIQCPNGDLNANTWQSLAALEPKVLSLGYNASYSLVQSTLCSDVKANISNAIEMTVYQIAALYYGWNFNPSPANILNAASCQNVDD